MRAQYLDSPRPMRVLHSDLSSSGSQSRLRTVSADPPWLRCPETPGNIWGMKIFGKGKYLGNENIWEIMQTGPSQHVNIILYRL